MSHHLRGTSDALAENVFITGRKGHGKYGRWPWVSTVQKRSGRASCPPVRLALAPRVLYGNYEAFRFVFAVAQGWAENICYGQRSARAIVMALIIDDDVHGRRHRRHIFNPNYDVAGAAYGLHAGYGSFRSIYFASGYAKGTIVRAGTDAANSF